MSDMVTGDFNYGLVDAETAAKLEYFAKTGKALIKKSQIEFIAKFGELLSDARKLLASHNKTEGTFVKWSTAEFDLSHQTIYNYVNAWDRVLSNGFTTYLNWSPTALYLASADNFPKPVQKKLEKIPSTDLVRACDVKRLVEANKPKPNPDDVPFDAAPALTPAAQKTSEAEAAKEKKKADAAAAKEKKKVDAAAAKEKKKEEAEAARAKKKAEAEATKQKKKEEAAKAREEAKVAKQKAALKALPKNEAAKNVRSILNQLIGKMMRSADDLNEITPNRSKHAALIKTLKEIEFW